LQSFAARLWFKVSPELIDYIERARRVRRRVPLALRLGQKKFDDYIDKLWEGLRDPDTARGLKDQLTKCYGYGADIRHMHARLTHIIEAIRTIDERTLF
jgi:hypothetical protein